MHACRPIIVALLLLPAPARALAADAQDRGPKAKAVAEEMRRLAGSWRHLSVVHDGRRVPDDEVRTLLLTLRADGTWVMRKGEEATHGTFTLDVARRPRRATFRVLGGKDRGGSTIDIYEVDGDRARFCFVWATTEPPGDFTSEPGSGRVLVTLEREKAR